MRPSHARRGGRLVMLLAGAAMLASGDRGAAQESEAQRLLEIVRAQEARFLARVQVASWTPVHSYGMLGDVDKPETFTSKLPPEYRIKARIIFQPGRGRYRIEGESTVSWVGGLDDFVSSAFTSVSDGVVRRDYERGAAGIDVPPPGQPADGRVRPADMDEAIFGDTLPAHSTLGFFPPFHMRRRLSRFLEERIQQNRPLEVVEQGDGAWWITAQPDEQYPINPEHEEFVICYDPAAGIVKWANVYAKPTIKKSPWAGKVVRSFRIEWRQIEKGIWVPARQEFVNMMDRQCSRMEYKDLKINEPVADSLFTIEFPKGTRVVDEVSKMRYEVTGGVIDQQKAMQEFMAAQVLYPPPDQRFWARNRWYLLSGAAVIGAAALGVGWRLYRQRAA